MKVLRSTLIFFFTLVVLIWVNQFFFCPRFQFNDSSPFSGNNIYNPYKSVNPDNWVKCNFHAHARVWNGITNGHGTANDIHHAYKVLNYGIHCVSNYQNIDTTNISDQSYIPAYEHGYNLNKTHQLVLGSNKVRWLDYPFAQSLNNKQDVLNHLKNSNSVVILNHPALRNGYSASDFSRLTNYDCMEVLNPSVISTRQWDAALSAGKKVFIVGDDDLHNVVTRDRLGKMCTFVNVRKTSKDLVFNALKSGNSYGVVLGEGQKIESIPYLKNLSVNNDTVAIEMSQSAKDVLITGQNGKTIESFHNLGKVKFVLSPQDHYARATFNYDNGTKVFLNPVFFVGNSDSNQVVVPENILETMLYRAMGVAILFFWLLLMGKLFLWKKADRYSGQWLPFR